MMNNLIWRIEDRIYKIKTDKIMTEMDPDYIKHQHLILESLSQRLKKLLV